MKIILTEDQYEQLTEMIKLDIKVGDTIMGGKFKNKKVVVKTIGKNDKGDITINGKPLLRFRILKENNFRLLRRESTIKKKLDSIIQNRFTNEEFQFMPFEHFKLHISDYVGTEMAHELNLMGDERVTFRNQIIQYVRNHFYEYLKEIWESKQNINESYDKNKIGSENFNRLLTKVVNSIINEYLKKTTTIDHDFDFRVKVRKGTDTPFVGCNAGSHGEPYNYVIEVYSDIEIPKYFTYNDEYKKNHNKISDGFHNSILSREIKDILPMIGLDIESLGNVFGVCFNGKTDDFSSNKPVSEGDYDDVSQINESNNKNKIFLKDKFGIDLDGKIKMIQHYEDLPIILASHWYPQDFNKMLNAGGPFYTLDITKGYKIGNTYVNKLYLYRSRADGSSFLIDQDGYDKSESTFLENLGVDVMGLTIKDLVNIYFNEEDQI